MQQVTKLAEIAKKKGKQIIFKKNKKQKKSKTSFA